MRMRVILEPYVFEGMQQEGWTKEYQWRASVEYGKDLASNFVAYGPGPTEAALNLAKYIASELLHVREELKQL